MTSEDPYYDNDRHSHRARKRGSTVLRKRRHRREHHYGHKTRRPSSWTNQSILRLASLVFVFMLVCYELAAFRNSLFSRSPYIEPAADKSSNAPPGQVARLIEESVAEKPSVDGASTAARVQAAVGTDNDVAEHEDALDEPSQRTKKQPPKTEKQKAVSKLAAAWEMVEKPADEDADEEPEVQPEEKGPEKKMKSEKSPNARPSRPKKAAKAPKPDSGDIEPPQPRAVPKTGEGGSEPGAGENFWEWFQETKGNENGKVGQTLKCPSDFKRLCEMFYKYLRKYKIRLVFDVSCAKNTEWMPKVIQKVGNELWGFKYFCSVPDQEDLPTTKESYQGIPFVEYDTNNWWKTGFPSETELLFAWDVLPHIAYGRVWNFFVHAKKQELKYVLVDNYPGILNDPSPKRSYLNLRKHPFRFPAAKEVAQNVTEPGETAKRQLLFYEGASLPDNLL